VNIFGKAYARLTESWLAAIFKYCFYDVYRYIRYSGAFHLGACEASRARVVMAYHVIEKGLTMPRRHLDFGHEAVRHLMKSVKRHEKRYQVIGDNQLENAIGVVKAYLELHRMNGFDMESDPKYWLQIQDFCSQYPSVATAHQLHFTREDFLAEKESSFPMFAESRHTVRNFDGAVSEELIRSSVRLAMTAPSACNRQHVKVYCISNHQLRDSILALQNGNRGFGHDADKLLIVTSDLLDMRWAAERNDGFTNAGIFIMNLSYALHYYQLASCILNWSVGRKSDLKLRKLVPRIGRSENVAAVLACGGIPKEFDVAASPRKRVEDVLSFVI